MAAPEDAGSSDSAVTVSGTGEFAGLRVTVSQTRALINQVVAVSWTGGQPTQPFTGQFGVNFLEHAWLRHLEQYHPEVLQAAVRHVAAGQPQCDGQVRPLGIDRLGVRLRVEGNSQLRDIRLAFRHPATTPVQLAEELYSLLGRPAVAQETR